jgi:hypothetical protein
MTRTMMMMMGFAAALASCTTGWGESSLPPPSNAPVKAKITKGCPPPEFDLAQLAHGGLGVDPQPKAKEVRLLAWKESSHEPEMYVDEALIWVETEADGFVVAHVGREVTRDEALEWKAAPNKDSGFPGTATTPAAPTHDQFERFLNQSAWAWKTSYHDDPLLSGQVCDDAWQKSFGAAPWHQLELNRPST